MQIFKNRVDAGRKLAGELSEYANRRDVILLALPRGGVPVAYEIAKQLNVPMDIFLVRKLGVPENKELAMGAIASEDIRVLNQDIIRSFGISDRTIAKVAADERGELQRRERLYRGDRKRPEVKDRTVILIDDGLATGATMLAAVKALRSKNPSKIVIAVPVASLDTCKTFEREVDDIICGATPEPFYGVGAWYEEFRQVTDEEVCDMLEKSMALQKSEED
ncbi:phosphoribosyltransferase [Methanohalophilus mahii]|uniref:Phosphoribosyltransferase n=1 Tax=Methanohalophilus mahii (strain ATCC 35705 / DSM 5219 / SLP) TaxID=547558 RepID=D5EBQ1_METMS|nr:phosphoribosyltransferase [Methanohalophilus mahii]ADE36602.1 phosphoribosyltransferase [Methanohalophilus mahii DSM 5219]